MENWTQTLGAGPLLGIALGAIALILVLIIKFRVHALLTMVLVSLLTLLAGVDESLLFTNARSLGDVRYLAWTGLVNLAVYLPLLLLALPFVDAALPGLAAGSWSVAIIWAAFALGYLGSRAVTLGLRARTDRWLVLGATR